MNVFESTTFRLLHFAAHFRSKQDAKEGRGSGRDVVALVEQLMSDGFYADEFAYLDDPNLHYFEMLPVIEKFLNRLDWQPLKDESEFRFMTALYSTIGEKNDLAAYHAIRRWMGEVGKELNPRFSGKFVADGTGAERIYACYYAFSMVNEADLIPSVENPARHN